MQTTGNRVTAATKFSTRVQDRENNLNGGLFLNRVHVNRNASTIVADSDVTVFGDQNIDVVAVSGEGFIDRVVNDFVNEMV